MLIIRFYAGILFYSLHKYFNKVINALHDQIKFSDSKTAFEYHNIYIYKGLQFISS